MHTKAQGGGAVLAIAALVLPLFGGSPGLSSPVAAPPPVVETAPPYVVPQPSQPPGMVALMAIPAAAPQPSAAPPPQTSTWRERAEDEDQITAQLGSVRPLVQEQVVIEGDGAFYLANPSFTTEHFTLNPTILPESDTQLFFESRIGYATGNQVARVQVSTNSGETWQDIWATAGTNDAGDPSFHLITLPLTEFAGTPIRIRFTFQFLGGSAYTQVSHLPLVGWVIDDIQIGRTFVKRLYGETGDPTPEEILMLEYINRARAGAAAEAARLSTTTDPDVLSAVATFGTDFNVMESQFLTLPEYVPPLAMNARLLAAARIHSEDMLVNTFQGHTSSAAPPPPNQPFDSAIQRVTRQGYTYSSLAENVYAHAQSVWHGHAGFTINWGNDLAGMQNPPAHRLTIYNPDYREVGAGIIIGSQVEGGITYGPMLVTQKFATGPGGGQPLITGVTYLDANANGFYDIGEGLGGVVVEVDGSGFYAVSSTHGAFAVPVVDDGDYTVTFRRPGYPPVSRQVTVSAGQNVKVDYRGESVVIESASWPLPETVQLIAATEGPTPVLNLQASGTLIQWTNLPHTQQSLPGGRTQLQATIPPNNRLFFRVGAVWPEE